MAARSPVLVIEGVPEVLAQLNEMDRKLSGEVTSAALQAGALPIQNRWKELVRDRAHKTGSYMRSIHTEVIAGHMGGRMREAIVGTDIVDPPYPFFLEFGTSRMAPRPTMRPALDEKASEAEAEVIDVLNVLLAQYGGK
jgi:HK97 gp10 family phage protein